MNLLVAGIHTGIGKTVCSAVLAEALEYDYWKPVQAGDLDNSDSIFVRMHVSNTKTRVHPEAFRLTQPASPHWAADQDGVEITLDEISLPDTTNGLIVETAGGVMSPLSHTVLNLDLIRSLQLPVVLVSENYLGSINHTLLTIAALRAIGATIFGLAFSGEAVPATREFLLKYSGLPHLFSIPDLRPLSKEKIRDVAASISTELNQKLHEFAGER